MQSRIGFIGAGKMAEAIAAGGIRGGVVSSPRDVVMHDKLPERLSLLEDRLGITVAKTLGEVVDQAGILVLAVKPQDVNPLLERLEGEVSSRHLVVSIVAGRRLSDLQERLGAGIRLVRVMPNLPLQVGEGMSVLCAGDHARNDDAETAARLFRCAGRVRFMPEEMFDAVTALSGSGPAFFAFLVQSLVSGARELGMEEAAARELAVQTMLGAAKVLGSGTTAPEDFIRAVASPGGTTAEGLKELRASDVGTVLFRTLAAATRRSRELSGGGNTHE